MRLLGAAFLCVLLLMGQSGSLEASWLQDGVGVCTAAGYMRYPAIVQDGAGGAIIVWWDSRVVDYNIYARRVDAGGNALWADDGMAICTQTGHRGYYGALYGEMYVLPDGAGGAFIFWSDARSGTGGDIYAQRVDAEGHALWTPGGKAICVATGEQRAPAAIQDGAGGAILSFSSAGHIAAQRIDHDGNIHWGSSGIPLSDPTGITDSRPQLVTDGSGGAVVLWRRWVDSYNVDVYAQRIDSSGTALWAAGGVGVLVAPGSQLLASSIASDGTGGAILAWYANYSSFAGDLYAQRVDGGGNLMWTAAGVPVGTAANEQDMAGLTSDGAGGAYIVWEDRRLGTDDIYAQRIDANGNALWAANGRVICNAPQDQLEPTIIPDGAGGAIVAWSDQRSGSFDIYAQKIDAEGSGLWAANGIPLCAAPYDQNVQAMVGDGSGGAIVAWEDQRNASCNIYAQRVDAAGHTVVATMLRGYSASAEGGAVRIEWTLSEAAPSLEFLVARSAGPSGPWAAIGAPDIRRDGLSYELTDARCEPGSSYRYRVDARDGEGLTSLFETELLAIPAMPFTLRQNRPNPFNPATSIEYYLPARCSVALAVYDVSGNLVRTLRTGSVDKGRYVAIWDGRNEGGLAAASGVYFCRLRAGKQTTTRTMILLR